MEQAGIEYEICTPTGRPALMEMWAMPERDLHIQEYFKANFTKFQEPTSLTSIVDTMEDEYVALFIPGGHGAMLGLPENRDVSKLIQWVKEKDLFLIALSHGPVALLAAKELKPHPFQGYKISACPDRTDRTRVKIGFLPGPMPWFMGEKLMDLEVVITNRRVAGNVQKDRKFLTGDGAKAANALGKLAVDCILEELKLSHVEQPEES